MTSIEKQKLLMLYFVNVIHLFVFFSSQLSFAVGDVNVQSSSAFDDKLTFFGGNAFSDFTSPGTVAHHQAIQFIDVMNQKLFETEMISASMSCVRVGTITDVWLFSLTRESSSQSTINT